MYFATVYFAARYFAPVYFPGDTGIVPPPPAQRLLLISTGLGVLPILVG